VQDQINERSVALCIKAAKLSGRVLARAVRAFLKKAREPTAVHGKQSVKSLTKQGASLTNIEISGENIGSFTKTARKFNVDFALKRDDSESPPKWLVFFKAKDTDSLQAAFNEYTRLTLKKDKSKGPSLTSVIQRAKELVGQIAAPVKNRRHGEREL
jgi:hypothetical protein